MLNPSLCHRSFRLIESESHWEEMEQYGGAEICTFCGKSHPLDWLNLDKENIQVWLEHPASAHWAQNLQQECCFLQDLRGRKFCNENLENFCLMLLNPANKRLQVQEYVNELLVSHQHLNKLCRLEIGKTLSDIVTLRNVLVIKMKMVQGSGLVKDIGFELGYVEPSNFNKFFKKHVGLTPSAYRKIFQLV